MKLTDEQRAAVISETSTFLEACPGSGKTRSIIAKLLRSAEEVRGTARRVACITYTNAAVYEIENRLMYFGTSTDSDVCEVSTIHSFCLNNILGRYHWHLPEFKNGYQILPPEDEYFQQVAREICQQFNLPTKIADQFELVHREPDGSLAGSSDLPYQAVLAFWNRLISEGFIDFPNIIYYSYRLMKDIPRIAIGLACRYSWILVDEFQDTSALQVEILREICLHRKTRLFLVGDPFQSIYGFAGARPDLMDTLADTANAKRGFSLTGNFRSTPPVIKHAERLLPRPQSMVSITESSEDHPVPEHCDGDDPATAILTRFIPRLAELGIPFGESAVMAPSWYPLLPIARTLRDAGIPVYGPGARPYKRSRLIAQFAEEVCAYIEERSPHRVRFMERSLFNLIQDATGKRQYVVYSYSGRTVLFRLIRIAESAKQSATAAGPWLKLVADGFSSILTKEGLLPAQARALFAQSADDMISDMLKQKIDPDSLTVESLGMFAAPKECVKLITMHGSKGREFDAVALIDLHDSALPNWRTHDDIDRIEEQRRLLYVAITRARRLVMYITSTSHGSKTRSRFLADVLNDD